jgi:hypothetical protein
MVDVVVVERGSADGGIVDGVKRIILRGHEL